MIIKMKKLEEMKIGGGLHIKPNWFYKIKGFFIAMYFVIRYGIKEGVARGIQYEQKKWEKAKKKWDNDINEINKNR